MTDKIERVAQAIQRKAAEWDGVEHTESYFETDWYSNGEIYESQARAAIEAMRKPTDSMRLAVPDYLNEKLTWRQVGDIYRAMIDEALK